LQKLNYDLPKVLIMNLSRRGFLRLTAGAVMLPKVAAGVHPSYPQSRFTFWLAMPPADRLISAPA
jgi:hypothetical protein